MVAPTPPYTLPSHREPLVLSCPIHGATTLSPASADDAFLIDLILSPAFQRLKGIHQHGISTAIPDSTLVRKGRGWVNRYDHSVGAMLLVRNLGANVEVQAAALLHDVAHTALSHVIDSVYGRVVHEEDKYEYLSTTDLPAIIQAHGFDPDRVFTETLFPLLELDSPKLCADRLDYALRDGYAFGFLSLEQVHTILKQLVDNNGEICCRSIPTARMLSDAYLASDTFAWANPSHSALYHYASQTIKEALRLSQITKASLYEQPCASFWASLVHSPHSSVSSLAALVRSDLVATPIPCRDETEGAVCIQMEVKVRCLDPTVWDGDSEQWRRLSEVDGEYAERLRKHRERNGVRWYRIE